MARVVVHIGMTKTGSTSIQAAFHKARAELLPLGIDYLDLGQNHSRVVKVALSGSAKRLKGSAARSLGLAEGIDAYDAGAVRAALEERLAARRAPLLVISGEGFFNMTEAEIAAFHALLTRHFDEIRIVAYLRDPLSWASSRAQENVKHGHTVAELTESVETDPDTSPIVPQYRRRLGGWIDAFGRAAVDIRVFDKRRFRDGDLIADFCAAIGADPRVAGLLPRPWNNPRTSHEALLLIEAHYRLLASRHAGRTTTKERRKAAKKGRRAGAEDGPDLGDIATDPDIRALAFWFRDDVRKIPGTPFSLPRPVLDRIWALVQDDLAWLRVETGDPALFADAWPPRESTAPAWSAETLLPLVERLDRSVGRRWRSEAMLWLRSGPQAGVLKAAARLRRALGR
ncbi:hypothetical protein [Prosthecomicrobium sp. N25]|uniref:hypothetical protein n=1 Tax=Prosthecomicrobium sp. N25 TaxID=3129254 RepID=UPI0030778B4F